MSSVHMGLCMCVSLGMCNELAQAEDQAQLLQPGVAALINMPCALSHSLKLVLRLLSDRHLSRPFESHK